MTLSEQVNSCIVFGDDFSEHPPSALILSIPPRGAILAAMISPRIHVAALLLLSALAPACKSKEAEKAHTSEEVKEPEPFGRLTIEELEAKMKAREAGQLKLAIIDNNVRERFDKGHIPGARWVKFDKVSAADLPADKETALVFYCSNEH